MDKSYAKAQEYDRCDTLSGFRDEFYIDDEKIYFDGNSLGILSKRAEKTALDALKSWKQYGIDGWTEGEEPWFYLSERLGTKTASLIGARASEVVATGSTTVNLHQLVSTFYQPKGSKTKILADELAFPTDIYALQSQLKLKGYDPEEHLVFVNSRDGKTFDEEDMIEKMTEDVALIVLPSVLYRSGQILPMKRLTKAAHDRNIAIGFDLCHSIGVFPHHLHDWGVDFAVWCNYKYLNAGPGAVGGLYVHHKHMAQTPGLTGWFGSRKDKQFDMEHDMTPADDAGAYQLGTPHILSAAPLIGSLELFEEAGLEQLRKKSLALTRYMMELAESKLEGMGFSIANPREDEQRGGHVYLEHREAARICKALKAKGIIPDFRAPKGIRLAPVPFYNTFTEVWRVIDRLQMIMEKETYKKYKNQRGVVA
ncbi:kynureninase [Salicibibacter cibarius]|uniref:Kynureninase n=1 Tax=Salicibibacter cibarius TaxID=2743000 RepID=A0A7T6Z0H6_9BACI|nr:kynureninase [Salicibibacter cibarius]QQK74427.1 kynureninase [Salicibibacter cibarius]